MCYVSQYSPITLICTLKSNIITDVLCRLTQKDKVFHFKIFCVHDRITNGGIELFVFSLCLFVCFANPNKNLPPTYTLETLRLIGGSRPGAGRVEISYNGSWGTVCDNDWDKRDAHVVCRQLGYPSAVSAPRLARFGRGSGKIWLDDVQCQGTVSYTHLTLPTIYSV